MSRAVFASFWSICILLLSACSWLAPAPELDEAARKTVQQLQAGDSETLVREAAPHFRDLKPEGFEQLRQLLPTGDAAAKKLIGYSQVHAANQGSSEHRLTYEYHWPVQVALIDLLYSQAAPGAKFVLEGVNARVATREELSANDFHLLGKPIGHYAMLLAIIASPALMIFAFVAAVRTPGLKRRWLWCLASLLTVCQYRLDWANGASEFVLLNVSLINTGIVRADSMFASWVLSTAFPLGAVIVLTRLYRRRQAAKLIKPT